MILGVDTGTATCGWARFDAARRRFDGLGALELGREKSVQKTDDHGDRIATIAGVLLAAMDGCNPVIVERMSFPPGRTVPIALGFGCVIGLARAVTPRPEVYTVKPQTWQRAVLPSSGKRVDYSELASVVESYLWRDEASAMALRKLEPKLRTHALDACAIALMGAYRLDECRRVKERHVA